MSEEASPLSTDVILLESAQDYIRGLLQQKTPDSLLSASWDEFYRVYSDLVRAFVVAQGLRGADADDCVQDVWTEVIARLVNFEHPESRPGLRAWLYAVVRSKSVDLLRRQARLRAMGSGRGDELAESVPDASSDPAAAYEKEWELALFRTLVAELQREVSARNAKLLDMRLLQGREVSDVAAVLGLTSEQVWYRQHRLVKKLRARRTLFTGNAFGGSDDDDAANSESEDSRS